MCVCHSVSLPLSPLSVCLCVSTLIGTGIVAAQGGGMVFLRSFGGPSTSHHTYTRTRPHVTAGGGRGSHKLSTLSGKEATDAKQVLGFSSREWGVVIAAGTIVGTFVSITTLMWYGMERIHQSEVARIKGDAETAQARINGMERIHQSEVARIKGDAETAQARIKGDAETAQEFMERFHQSEIARIKGEADNKVEMYQYYVQAVGTQDHKPLMKALSRRRKEYKQRAQAKATGESGGKEGKWKSV